MKKINFMIKNDILILFVVCSFVVTTTFSTILVGCNGGGGSSSGALPPDTIDTRIEEIQELTNSEGEAKFDSELLGQTLKVKVVPNEGAPIQDMNVKMVTDGTEIFMVTYDPTRQYFPNFYCGSANFPTKTSSLFKSMANTLLSRIYNVLVPDAHGLIMTGSIIVYITISAITAYGITMTLSQSSSFAVMGIYGAESAVSYNNIRWNNNYSNWFAPKITYIYPSTSLVELENKFIIPHMEDNNLDWVYVTVSSIESRFLAKVRKKIIGKFLAELGEALGYEGADCTVSVTASAFEPNSDVIDLIDIAINCVGEYYLPDKDHDGVADIIDNCLNIYNPDQIDGDEDGFGLACDCDDTDYTTYPGAQEWRDWRDNNCDGRIDDPNPPFLIEYPSWYKYDNGCDATFDYADPIEWDFEWLTDGLATRWYLYVISTKAIYPVVNTIVTNSHYHYQRQGSANSDVAWRWMVRAIDDNDQWSDPSEGYFNVEMHNIDCAGPPPPPPELISPQSDAVLDNNCPDRSDYVEWYFDWSDVPEASWYCLYVAPKQDPVHSAIQKWVYSSSYHYLDPNVYFAETMLDDWFWWVHVHNDITNQWSYSEVRYFRIEPPGTDCQ